jgi:hypothetical protein
MDAQKVVLIAYIQKKHPVPNPIANRQRLKRKCMNDGKHETHNNCVLVDFATRPHQCKLCNVLISYIIYEYLLLSCLELGEA